METLPDRTSRLKIKLVMAAALFVFLPLCCAALFAVAPLYPHSGEALQNSSRRTTTVLNLEDAAAGDLFPFLRTVKFKGTMIMSTQVSIDGMLKGTLPVMSEISLQGVAAQAGTLGIDMRSRDLKLSVQGLYDAAGDRLDIMMLQARLPEKGLLNIQGTVYGVGSDSPVMELTAEGRMSAGEIKDILSGPAVKWLEDLDIEAEGEISLTIAGSFGTPRIAGNLLVRGKKLRAQNILVLGYRAEVPFRYGGDSLNLRDVLLRADEIVPIRPGSTDGLQFRFEKADVRIPAIEFRSAFIKTGIMEARIERIRAQNGDRVRHEEKNLVIRGAAQYDPSSRTASFSAISLNSDFLKNIAGDAAVSLNDPLTVDARILYDDFSLAEIAPELLPHFPVPGQTSVHGSGSVRAAVNISKPGQGEGRVAVTMEADVRDAGFSSHDETVIAEGIAATATGTAGFSLPVRDIDFALDSRARGFELLAGLFYGNFAGKSLDISVRGTYAATEDALRLDKAELNLTDTGRVVLAGDVTGLGDRTRFRGDISLLDVSNREGYNLFIRETFREKYPFLAGIDVDGQSAVKLSVDGTADSFTAVGAVTVDRLNVEEKEQGRSVQDLNMYLPVSFYRGNRAPVPVENNYGFFRVRNVSWGPIIIGGIEVFPVVRANALLFSDDITIPVFGGTVVLKDVSYTDLLSPARMLSLAVEVNRVDLARMTGALDIPQFSGDISGTIPSAVFTENRLVTEGEIHLALFDGSMRISGLSMDRVFSPIPSLACSIDVEDIDLGRLTATFDFGHISGAVRGSVRDLVIVRGQAQSFRASIESIRKKGVSQKISVEALKKISILGSGTSSTILDRGIYQLFKEYRYAKLGFRGVLRNDNLRLQGIETRDSRGYLVKGGFLPPRVDVISYNQDISFSELVRRLKRVTQAGGSSP